MEITWSPTNLWSAIAKLVKIEIAGDSLRIEDWLGSNIKIAVSS
jgi:hypothetical protein